MTKVRQYRFLSLLVHILLGGEFKKKKNCFSFIFSSSLLSNESETCDDEASREQREFKISDYRACRNPRTFVFEVFVKYLSRYSVPNTRVVSDKYPNLEVSVGCSAAHRSSNSYDLLSRTLNLTREVASTRQQTYSVRHDLFGDRL